MTTFTESAIPTHASDYACVDFVNSEFTDHLGSGESIDRLESPEWLEWFLDRYDLLPDERSAPPVRDLVALRRDIRRSLDKWSRQDPLNRRDLRLIDEYLRAAPLRMRLAQS